MKTIVCRAQVSDDCYNDQPITRQFDIEPPHDVADEYAQEKCVGEGGHFLDEAGDCERCTYHEPVMNEDGTWDGRSIVCDPCYIELMPFTRSGRGENSELPEAIDTVKVNLKILHKHDNPEALLAEAKKNMERARPGSPYHRSSEACTRLAEKEIERRRAA